MDTFFCPVGVSIRGVPLKTCSILLIQVFTAIYCVTFVCVCVVQDSYVWDLQLVSDVRAGKAPKVL